MTTAGACLAAAGCVTAVENYQPASARVMTPAPGAVASAAVGDRMLRQGEDQLLDAIELERPVSVGSLARYTLAAGHYVKRGQTAQGEFFNVSGLPGGGRVSAGGAAEPYSAVLLKKDGRLCVVDIGGRAACSAHARLRRIQVRAPAPGLQQALIYRGRVGERISVGYRESSGAFPSAGRDEDVDYDLTDSDLIGYKGARLQVLKATNEYVRYRVIRGFGPASAADPEPAAALQPGPASLGPAPPVPEVPPTALLPAAQTPEWGRGVQTASAARAPDPKALCRSLGLRGC